ncbi:Copper amine oxidase N-terminal domain-containing protein [Paenibacillus sp. 1_12]|uniref:copper amine oxidase N-terminal domain-containing protein n=1 Tax=Paenibacillus sp. 1_12 TaxID=1566278 RepID=UPI0008DFA3F4|nr:copper amine oxidase N-terminal domain-containing protein [Paenibacillus sp. 1_12]SFM16851.1 Copper amine oxidase N-terminal domain-containing protein [Paenibacillus sp. 1_12]
MRKFVMGAVVGSILSLSTVVVASDSIQTVLFPAYFTINGQHAETNKDSPVLNYNGQTYVPARFIAEQLGAFVDYNDDYKEIIINHFPSHKDILTDNKYPNVHFSLIGVYLDGDYTVIRGMLSVDKLEDPTLKEKRDIEFSLNFYDESDTFIGTASGSSKTGSSLDKKTISTGEIKIVNAGEVGDFSKFSKVSFQVTSFK